ncbi:DNRLRE domain-containing protein [Paenibacillus sp. HB172176]|uniref:CBM96 family carbohydrate-binding protein n=1 Tax=Paenibacillus sp. HB172176 TaxID=2493690 RepID=UPI00143AC327|nr:DNRLRE domain-containing protein [Paenibacillus sp. HB172176]
MIIILIVKGFSCHMALKGDTNTAYVRKSYMKADLQGWDGVAVDQAGLYFYNSTVVDATYVRVRGLADDTWTETGLTWNNQPSESLWSHVGDVSMSEAGWYTLDVTSYVNEQLSAEDRAVSLVLVASSNTVSPFISLASNKHATLFPCLILEE